MLKFYMWLATGHLVFIKVFGHFYEMLWYLFYQGKTKGRKIKGREIEKGKDPRISAQLIPPSPPAWPTPPTPLSSSSTCSLSSMPSPAEDTVTARPSTPPPRAYLQIGRA